jgi:hypothetical protein
MKWLNKLTLTLTNKLSNLLDHHDQITLTLTVKLKIQITGKCLNQKRNKLLETIEISLQTKNQFTNLRGKNCLQDKLRKSSK